MPRPNDEEVRRMAAAPMGAHAQGPSLNPRATVYTPPPPPDPLTKEEKESGLPVDIIYEIRNLVNPYKDVSKDDFTGIYCIWCDAFLVNPKTRQERRMKAALDHAVHPLRF